jgi:hypothetical protein
MLAAYPLHELHSKASKSVFVGNDKFADSACADAFQNGRKTFAVEVEATGGVADELSAGVAFTKVGTLTFEVARLFGRGDAGVEKNDASVDWR